MNIPKDNSLIKKAKTLRKEMTPHERKLWYMFLKNYPVKIYKQRIIGDYIVDFYCAGAKVVIELDGSQHYDNKDLIYDSKRDHFLESLGLKVYRIPNSEINDHFRGVCEELDRIIQSRL